MVLCFSLSYSLGGVVPWYANSSDLTARKRRRRERKERNLARREEKRKRSNSNKHEQ